MEHQTCKLGGAENEKCYSLVGSKEDRATIYVLPIVLGHCLRSGLRREYSFVAIVLQFGLEEVVKLVGLNLLKAYDVGRIVTNLVQNCLLKVEEKKLVTHSLIK